MEGKRSLTDETLDGAGSGIFLPLIFPDGLAVGFEETKAHATALVRYIVPNGGTIDGNSTFHLLRKTDQGWQKATEISKCGRIY